MRAARLLRLLLILQNRGRQTARQLADDLEVTPRTILRDVDAMTEAGLPIIVHQGNRGGIELGFDYRTRLTGLARDEAEALGLILAADSPMLAATGLARAADRARTKLIESLPDRSRVLAAAAADRFVMAPSAVRDDDARIPALAAAIRDCRVVRLRYGSADACVVHPVALRLTHGAWALRDDRSGNWLDRAAWGRVNVSAARFGAPDVPAVSAGGIPGRGSPGNDFS